MNKRYLFVTTHFAPAFEYGGVVESGTRLFKYLAKLGDFKIATISENPEKFFEYNGDIGSCYKSNYLHRFAFSWSSIFGLFKDVKSSDVLLINGIFTFPVTLTAIYAIILNKPFIVAVRGGLEPWRVAHKQWKKYLYIKFVTLPLMRKAKYIHVTALDEQKNIKKLGFDNTLLSSNGIDLELFQDLPSKFEYSDSFDDKFIFLFLSRTDKEKGLDILIQAYKKFCESNKNENHLLLIVGPDHQGYLKSLNINYAKSNIKYLDGVYGDDKIKLIRRSDVVLLPSYSENFGNIIAEGFACERPVITTTGTPWSEIENVGGGLYINPKIDELYDAMLKIYDMSENERMVMGEKGRKYIFENFDWAVKAREIFEVMEKL